MNVTKRPNPDEYNPSFSTYISLVPEGDIETILQEQIEETLHLLNSISEQQAHFKYAPEKWSIKEVLGHLADAERIMAYRLLTIARGDSVSLPGFEENEYVQSANFNRQSIKELLENLHSVRQSTIHLLKGLEEETWLQKGNANHSVVSVRALAYIITGHEIHHRRILKERYLEAEAFQTL